ncbi:hypothetical protein V495_00834 [Pseudogymnoascus sp. VKM F-4514 (FW-929)]|nr:hypothetical protein V495_00834 [Pseudogymnoascus sp. VKM F-4514 (FW-929)]KFY51802.1 hypothetical protein V497_08837 [Pseudogymnoascus sp. VKM F-4516 (FW-969)]
MTTKPVVEYFMGCRRFHLSLSSLFFSVFLLRYRKSRGNSSLSRSKRIERIKAPCAKSAYKTYSKILVRVQLVLATSTMPVLTFSRSLLASAVIFWLVCLGADVACGLQKNPRVDPTAALCFFGAVAAAFIAGAVYGREAEYEKSQHKMESKQDLASQPLLDSEKGENGSFHGTFC